jgi:hypothetical protein
MLKLDFKQDFKTLYTPSAKAAVMVDVPKLNFLMIDGAGDPNTSAEYQAAIEALYSLAYTLKFALKKAEVVDYGVAPLEGLWWADDMSAFTTGNKADWKWTMMIMQPEQVTPALLEQVRGEVKKKKNLTNLSAVRLESLEEGRCAQIMHIGPYAAEAPTIEKLHEFIKQSGCNRAGKHHEIYLSDPRRAAPEKMRTIIRQGVS